MTTSSSRGRAVNPLGLGSSTTYHDAHPDDLAIAIGYPHHSLGSGDGLLAYSVGQVLSDARASAAIAALAAAGDPEGAVPYDAEVEVVIGGPAAIGMSGGGLFDHDGALLGVLVRATPQLQVESNRAHLRAL